MGHPAPFKMNYIEIGNENWGLEYEERYQIFHKTISQKYPHIKFVANSHLEKKGFQQILSMSIIMKLRSGLQKTQIYFMTGAEKVQKSFWVKFR